MRCTERYTNSLYGRLGNGPEVANSNVPYDGSFEPDRIRAAAGGIRIIHEDVPSEEFLKAAEVLENAERICFIGFGYGETNLNRLIKSVSRRDQYIFGCAAGFTSRESEIIRARLNRLGFQSTHSLSDYCHIRTVIEFLRQACPLDWE